MSKLRRHCRCALRISWSQQNALHYNATFAGCGFCSSFFNRKEMSEYRLTVLLSCVNKYFCLFQCYVCVLQATVLVMRVLLAFSAYCGWLTPIHHMSRVDSRSALYDDSTINIILLPVLLLIIIRPPGTLVPGGLMFYAWRFFLSPRDLRAASADRRETLPHDRNVGVLSGGPSPKEIGGQKHAKFGAISCNFRLRSQISPERETRYPKSESDAFTGDSPPRSMKKVRWTLVH